MADAWVLDLPVRLSTAVPAVSLVRLTPADAPALLRLIQTNRDHLTQHGDYEDLVAKNAEQLRQQLGGSQEAAYGIRRHGELIGSATLIRHRDGVYGLGYWIGAEQAGCGYVTACCLALIDLARDKLDAGEIWAGITHGNEASINVVTRLGFSLERTQPTHLSYLLRLAV